MTTTYTVNDDEDGVFTFTAVGEPFHVRFMRDKVGFETKSFVMDINRMCLTTEYTDSIRMMLENVMRPRPHPSAGYHYEVARPIEITRGYALEPKLLDITAGYPCEVNPEQNIARFRVWAGTHIELLGKLYR